MLRQRQYVSYPRRAGPLGGAPPAADLSVATLGTRDALRELREGGVEAAIVTLPIEARGIRSVPLREQLVAALPPTHPLAASAASACRRWHPSAWSRFWPARTTRDGLIDDAFSRRAVRAQHGHRLESVQAIKMLSALDLGWRSWAR